MNIYFDNRKLILSKPDEIIKGMKTIEYKGKENLFELITSFEKDLKTPEITIVHSNYEKLWKDFKSYFKIIEASGGLVENADGKLLFIYRHNKWDLPKGKREKGESTKENAIREVTEETGLKSIKILSPLMVTYHTYFLKGYPILKKTNWFHMYCSNNETLIPQVEEDITRVEWLDKSQFPLIMGNTYASIKELLEKIIC